MTRKRLKAVMKWEVKTGKNRGYYVACTPEQAERFFPQWGGLDSSYWSTECIRRKHGVPHGLRILTHSIWARGVMRPTWERVEIVEQCYKPGCKCAVKYATHTDKNGRRMPHARFTCETHHYAD